MPCWTWPWLSRPCEPTLSNGPSHSALGYTPLTRDALTYPGPCAFRHSLNVVLQLSHRELGRRKDVQLQLRNSWKAVTNPKSYPSHNSVVEVLAVSADNRILASASRDRTIIVRDIYTMNRLCTLTGHGACVTCLVLSPDGRHAISGSEDQTLRVWRLPAASTAQPTPSITTATRTSGSNSSHRQHYQCTQIVAAGGRVVALAINSNGHLLVSASDSEIKMWVIKTQGTSQSLGATNDGEAHRWNEKNVAGGSCSCRVSSGGGCTGVHNDASGTEGRISAHMATRCLGGCHGEGNPSCTGCSSQRVDDAGYDNTTHLCVMLHPRNFIHQQPSLSAPFRYGPCNCLTLSGDGNMLAGGFGSSVVVVSIPSGTTIQVLRSCASSLAFALDYSVVVCASQARGQPGFVWSLASGKLMGVLSQAWHQVVVTQDGKTVVSFVGSCGRVGIWDLDSVLNGKSRAIMKSEVMHPVAGAWSLAASPDMKWLFTGGRNGDVLQWMPVWEEM